MAASTSNTAIILTAIVCAAIAAFLVFQLKDFFSAHRRWHGVRVKDTTESSTGAKKRRRRIKKPKSTVPQQSEELLTNPIVIVDQSEEGAEDEVVKTDPSVMARKKELDSSLTRAQALKLQETNAKLLSIYQQCRRNLGVLRTEQRKRMFAGNSFATRLDIMDDSDDESELDVSEVPLAEVASFITEEIDRVKAQITDIKKTLAPLSPNRSNKHAIKPVVKKKQVDDEGWQTIGQLKPAPTKSKAKGQQQVVLDDSMKSTDPVVSILSEDDNEMEWQEAGATADANKGKAIKKRASKKRAKKASNHPPIPGLVYVK